MLISFCRTMCDFSFRGRSGKKEFLSFLIFNTIIFLLFTTLVLFLSVCVLELNFDSLGFLTIPLYKLNPSGWFFIIILCFLVIFYAFYIIWSCVIFSLLSIRRFHDINYSGVCFWVYVAAFILFIVQTTSILTIFLSYFLVSGIIILACMSSYPYRNKYGEVNSPYRELQVNS